MANIAKWKLVVILAVLLLSAYYLYPTVRWYSMSKSEQDNLQKVDYLTWRSLFSKKLNLGLDLQGGVSLLLKVDTATLEQMAMDKEIESINLELERKGNTIRAAFSETSTSIVIPFNDESEKNAITEIIKTNSDLIAKDFTKPKQFEYMLDPRITSQKIKETMEQARHVIENRVNELGVSETPVSMIGNDRISVELPGEQDPERATNIIRRQAFLEFKLEGDEQLLNSLLNEQGEVRAGSPIPEGYELKYMKNSENGEIRSKPILLRKRAELTGDHITSAKVARDSMSMGTPFVELTLDREGSRIFEHVTAMNVNKKLAIVLDGEVKSDPNIQERIPNGRARITGQYTENDAKDLALVLRSGALPAPLIVEESRLVGPSLGYDSIHKGILSSIIGGLLVVIFMVIYYKGSGIIADLALILNLYILVAAMSFLHATLTVPGIAGIVLTIGMAVDANILIFERIREELHGGKTPRAAIESGYNRAFHAILDSNVTTIISSIMLYEFGSGAVRGFAITLGVGIAINLFTAVMVTKVIFDWLSLRPGYKHVSIE